MVLVGGGESIELYGDRNNDSFENYIDGEEKNNMKEGQQ